MPTEHSFGCIVVHTANAQSRYLLVRQLTHWSFPKGHTEGNETPFDTAKREIYEECGISFFNLVPELEFTEEYTFNREGVPTKKVNTFFVATVETDEIHPQPAEILECTFAPYATAREMLTYESQKSILDKAHTALQEKGYVS